MGSHSLGDHGRTAKRTIWAAVLVIICIPVVIAADVLLFEDRSYYAVSLIIIALSMVPFALIFEGRKPRARELVVTAVMVAITVAGRAAFFMVPQVKPVAALVIIAGTALGAESGFAVGALSGFVSNFIFGQGPWTPWQMFAFGLIGFLSGVVFNRLAQEHSRDVPLNTIGTILFVSSRGHKKDRPYCVQRYVPTVFTAPTVPPIVLPKRAERLRIIALCAFGGVITFALYGLLLDTAAAVMFSSGDFSVSALVATYLAGLPMNAVHAIATVVFLALLARPMLEKLERAKRKYGLLR